VLLHIGYPKNASTWLQKYIFNDPAKGFVCRWNPVSGLPVEEFLLSNPVRFDPHAVRERFDKAHDDAGRLVPVLSHECLCTDPFCTRYFSPHAFELAERLHATFPEAQIFLVFREQKSMLLSMYREYISSNGGEWPIGAYIGTGDEQPGYAPFLRLDYLEYDLLLKHYIKLFGPPRVLALPFEWLRKDGIAFEQRIHDFCRTGVTASEHMSPYHVTWKGCAMALRRQLNKLVHLPPGHWKPTGRRVLFNSAANLLCRVVNRLSPAGANRYFDERLKRVIAARVKDYYRQSNRELQDVTGVDLKSLGYDVG
jgi:hypothetical protein